MPASTTTRAARLAARACATLGLIVAAPGCAVDDAPPAASAPTTRGPIGRSLDDAADAAALPRDLVAAVAIVEDGLRLPPHRRPDPSDELVVAGRLELRRGALDSLALGARLVGASEAELVADTDRATTAGARVLATLGRDLGAAPDDLASFRPALARLSGLRPLEAARYADQVLAVLHDGAAVTGWAGERIVVAAHPEVALAPPIALAATEVPDTAGAEWIATDCTGKCTFGRPDGDAAVDTIVIHDTEGGWNASVATLQNKVGVSVHYIVDADGGRVGQFVHERDTAWHAGNWSYNMHSIGIEHVGYVADPGYQPGLYDRSEALVADIRARWNVPLDRQHIVGHYQIPDGDRIDPAAPVCAGPLATCEGDPDYGGSANHTDPGIHWQWCQYLEALGGTCTCADANPTWTCTTDATEAVRCQAGAVELLRCADGCVDHGAGVDAECQGAVSPDQPDAGGVGASEADAGPVARPGGVFLAGCTTGGADASTLGGLVVALWLSGRAARRRARG